MASFETLRVGVIIEERAGLQRVRLDDGSRAYVLTQLTGPVAVGDEVVVNTTAVHLGLGTGGWHVVHWNLSRREWAQTGSGHIMKLRYTSLQVDTGAAEEAHPDLPAELDGTPVVVCSLHSQIAGVMAAAHAVRPQTSIGYVMTDGASLPIALSDLVTGLRDTGLLRGTVTAGHAFGGDLEAVNVPSAVTLARHVLGCDLIVVAMGPGVVGTGSRLGTTALEVAPVLDAVAWLGGEPVICARISGADARVRHRGMSHHTLTILDAVRSQVHVPLPTGGTLDPVDAGPHLVTTVDPPDVGALLDRWGLRVTTMGRDASQEPAFFAACGAAGVLAADLADRAADRTS
ncbi:MAG: DUF3866 family protein [Actinomycetota bacterium]|nr:DUF3866 family protein [Actinomycetota bacterium]